MKELSEREKAALTYGFLNPGVTFSSLYKIAFDTTAKDTSIAALASNWKSSASVQTYLRNLDAIEEARLKEKIATMQEQQVTGMTDGQINFSDMEEFLKYAELKANTTNDEKIRLDYLKIISDLRRYKETSKDGETEIQRFYTPLLCSECEIYKEAKKKLEK